MEEDHYFPAESQKRSGFFIFSIAVLLFFTLMGIGIDTGEYSQRKEINIPDWYFYLIFSVDVLIILSLVVIYFQKKIGVLLFPVMVLIHFFLHLYYLDTFIYSDITNLFLFVGVGLLAIIPRWKFFT